LDKTLRVWDAQTGQLSKILRGHNKVVSSATYSPNGAWIISSSHDGTIKLWDTQFSVQSVKGLAPLSIEQVDYFVKKALF
jgi:WD40 repeat protein